MTIRKLKDIESKILEHGIQWAYGGASWYNVQSEMKDFSLVNWPDIEEGLIHWYDLFERLESQMIDEGIWDIDQLA